jgi:hypothetical protein
MIDSHYTSALTTEIYYSIKDHVQNRKRVVSKAIQVYPNEENSSLAPSKDESNSGVILSAVSASGLRKAILRKENEGERLFVDIWRNDILEVSQDVTKFHGPFYDGISCTRIFLMRFKLVILCRCILLHPLLFAQ